MNILCFFGIHKLKNCICTRCGDAFHDIYYEWEDIYPKCTQDENTDCRGGSCVDYCPDYPGEGYRKVTRKCSRCGYTDIEKQGIPRLSHWFPW